MPRTPPSKEKPDLNFQVLFALPVMSSVGAVSVLRAHGKTSHIYNKPNVMFQNKSGNISMISVK